MKKDISYFFHNVEKWSAYLKNPAVFTLQDFNSMFNNFFILLRKELNYNFKDYFLRNHLNYLSYNPDP